MNDTTNGGSRSKDELGSTTGPVHAWALFFVFGLLIAAHGLYMVVLPTAQPDHWRSYTSNPDMIAYLADEFRASGAMQIALGALTMLIAMRWFRAGDPWAWMAFWIFPVLFAWEMVTTWAVALWLIVFLAAAAALVATYSQFFRRSTTS